MNNRVKNKARNRHASVSRASECSGILQVGLKLQVGGLQSTQDNI